MLKFSIFETYRTILITPGVIRLHSDEKDQDGNKSLDRIRPSSKCHISTSDMVVRRHLSISLVIKKGQVSLRDKR
jgi:hypothetical protein